MLVNMKDITIPSDIRFKCPHCDQAIEQPLEMLGQLIDCPSCGETIEVQKPHKQPLSPADVQKALRKLKLPVQHSKVPGKLGTQRTYKVLTPTDPIYEGSFELTKLEAAINHYAAKGWHVISVVPTGPDNDIVVVMCKSK